MVSFIEFILPIKKLRIQELLEMVEIQSAKVAKDLMRTTAKSSFLYKSAWEFCCWMSPLVTLIILEKNALRRNLFAYLKKGITCISPPMTVTMPFSDETIVIRKTELLPP
jgi:hypothetical protein